MYVRALDRLFRSRVGIASEDAQRWDISRLFRAPGWDDGFRADAMLPALEATLAGLGVDLRTQGNVELDLESRPKKSPRAFCAPIEVPGRVMLVIQPIGGADDWHALFHEAGHTEHYAHTSAEPLRRGAAARRRRRHRRMGDAARAPRQRAALARAAARLRSPPRVRRRGGGRAALLRPPLRGQAPLRARAALDEDLDSMPARYVEYMREATKIEYWEGDFLSDVDPGFYASGYLRAWALRGAAPLVPARGVRHRLVRAPAAGSLLRELWYEGEGMTADEILREVTGAELDLDAVRERIWETIA